MIRWCKRGSDGGYHTSFKIVMTNVLIFRSGVARHFKTRWQQTKDVPCDKNTWMTLVGPAVLTGVQTVFFSHSQAATSELPRTLSTMSNGCVDLVIDTRGLGAYHHLASTTFWDEMHRLLRDGGKYMGTMTTSTRRSKYSDALRARFDGHTKRKIGNFEIGKLPTVMSWPSRTRTKSPPPFQD